MLKGWTILSQIVPRASAHCDANSWWSTPWLLVRSSKTPYSWAEEGLSRQSYLTTSIWSPGSLLRKVFHHRRHSPQLQPPLLLQVQGLRYRTLCTSSGYWYCKSFFFFSFRFFFFLVKFFFCVKIYVYMFSVLSLLWWQKINARLTRNIDKIFGNLK